MRIVLLVVAGLALVVFVVVAVVLPQMQSANAKARLLTKGYKKAWFYAFKRNKPICDIETGCRSVTVCHLGNIAYKLGRSLRWDPEREVFVGATDQICRDHSRTDRPSYGTYGPGN